MGEPETDTVGRRPFAAVMQEARKGGLHDEASEAVASVTEQVIDVGKPGTVTIKLTIKPGPEDGTVEIIDEVKAVAPKPKRRSVFFADDHGNLSRRDPRQPELPLAAVENDRQVS